MIRKTWILPVLILFCTSLAGQEKILTETNFSSVVGAGARALGMGGAFIAIADDATAASWNPAGLAQLERFSLSLVSRFDNYRALSPARGDVFSGFFMGAEQTQSTFQGLDFASLSLPVRLGRIKLVPQLSFQRAICFNLKNSNYGVRGIIPYEDFTSGEKYFFQGNFYNEITYSGGFDVISFSLGTRILPWLNLGVSVNYWMNGYQGELSRGADGGDYYVQNQPEIRIPSDYRVFESRYFDIRGLNFNIGLLVELAENLRFGLVYKTAFSADIDYRNKIQSKDFRFGNENQKSFEAAGSSTLLWPRSFGLGISYRPSDPLTFSLDYTNAGWSRARLLGYQSEGRIRDVYFPTLKDTDSKEILDFQSDAEQIRLGVEFVIFGQEILVPLRLGFFSDYQYYADASGQRVLMTGLTAGLGLKMKKVSFDVALVYQGGSYLNNPLSYSFYRVENLRLYFSTIISL